MQTFTSHIIRVPQIKQSNGDTTTSTNNNVEVKEDEEKAVCRICYDVCEERNTINMGCSCKGDVGFIHEECAVRWFKFKGNKKCDVCAKDVSHSTITSLPPPLPQTLPPPSSPLSSWKVFLILVVINTIAYFFFIILIGCRKWIAKTLIILAPSFVLAILASLFAVFIGKECTWLYAFAEFAFFVQFFVKFYFSVSVLRFIFFL
ncbi:ERAD-associated E3 ubiquitin-protein ligase DOA10-like [Impatiens glandulifera]|uniref:ERAD-associated E3 ubiquitin-protein ligase DOA10-like n=1 Tax=Impatiens glandulifera TaxID=253017 RepID=UPI001FB0F2FA|nr:ERAD-associated E3 ubiquitin-protein ligase DOA10-like [Impatiens glandulifera]